MKLESLLKLLFFIGLFLYVYFNFDALKKLIGLTENNCKPYMNFGVKVPQNYTWIGIDISHHQGVIDWQRVAKMKDQGRKINFVFTKCSEGVSVSDPQYFNNVRGLRSVGITKGAYHFFHPSVDPFEQAMFFISRVSLESGDLPPVLDVEVSNELSSEMIRKSMKIWLDAVEKSLSIKPIIYTNVKFYDQHLKNYFDDYTLWIANYGVLKPGGNYTKHWKIWQFTDKANIDGICGHVDMNVFITDSSAFANMLYRPKTVFD